MVRLLLGATVLGVSLIATGANAHPETPTISGATVSTESGVQVIRGSAVTYPERPVVEAARPAQSINIAVKAQFSPRRGLAVVPMSQ